MSEGALALFAKLVPGCLSPFRSDECPAYGYVHCRLVLYCAPFKALNAPRGLFTPRWVEMQQTYGIERPQGLRSEMYIHRLPPSHGILHMPPWERVVATHDLWPDELVADITGWFDDLRGRWPNVEWWVRRVHEASASSSMPLLQQVNYVLITSEDFHAFARNPHGLMELGFREPQLCTTVLPCLINLPILRTFLAPLWAGMQTGHHGAGIPEWNCTCPSVGHM